ncbi:MAG: hypothetical protein WD894_23740 [Pirellulales bacterium]
MHLHQALLDIAEIRNQIARTEQCRALRSASVGFSGVLAFIAAAIQVLWIPVPQDQIERYLGLWTLTAVLGFAVPAGRLVLRYYRSESELLRSVTRLAFEQIAPPLVAGALLTYTLYRTAPESLWLLPGLWSVLFALCVFASHRLFPRATVLVGLYYLAAGVLCLLFARGEAAFSAWAMVGTFGVGQLFAAAVLYAEWERQDG